VIYERVELIDGTIDVAPGLGFGRATTAVSPNTSRANVKDRSLPSLHTLGRRVWRHLRLFWGTYDPEFYTNDEFGRRVKLVPSGLAVATPLGNISTGDMSLAQYRMKIWMKMNF
jgi:hypothetical protein